MEVIRGLLSGEVNTKTAGLLLYGLQMASANLKYVCFEPKDRASVVRDVGDLAPYCDVDADVETDGAKAGTHAGDGRREEPRAAINDSEIVEPGAQAEARVPAEDLEPQTVAACDLEPAPDGVACADRSSTERPSAEHSFANQSVADQSGTEQSGAEQSSVWHFPNGDSPSAEEMMAKLRAQYPDLPSLDQLPVPSKRYILGISSTQGMLDALAELHRLAKVVVDAQREIGGPAEGVV